MTDALTIREALSCGKQGCPCMNGRGSLTHCCAHSDRSPSLSVRDGEFAPLVTCQTGCSRESVIAALKARRLWPQREQKAVSYRREPVRTYRYISETGDLVVEKGRFEYLDRQTGEQKKWFNWRLPGEERWGNLGDHLKVEDLPLFNLPDVLRRLDEPVWFVEGEKACEALVFRGVLAVCLAGGASQRLFGDSLTYLVGREVVIWPDNDVDGFALAGKLLFHIPDARVIRPATDLPGGDAYDYFEAGGTVAGMAEFAEARIIQLPPPNVTPIYARPEYRGVGMDII